MTFASGSPIARTCPTPVSPCFSLDFRYVSLMPLYTHRPASMPYTRPPTAMAASSTPCALFASPARWKVITSTSVRNAELRGVTVTYPPPCEGAGAPRPGQLRRFRSDLPALAGRELVPRSARSTGVDDRAYRLTMTFSPPTRGSRPTPQAPYAGGAA